MAEIIKNIKGFKVLKVGVDEIINIRGLGICDSCGKSSESGYYVAVLNMWFCPACYNEWMLRATYYKEDKKIEDKNYENMRNLLG